MSKSAMLACLLVLIGLAIIPMLGDKHAMDVTVEIMILALFALSLNVLIGYSGNVSFGHAAYFAIGGYTNAILLTSYDMPLIVAMPVAILFSMVAAMFVAWFCTRLTDIYFAMLTLAFAMLVWAILFKWRGMTNGDDGFVGITIPAFLDGRIPLYYFTLVIVAASIGLLWLICHSAFGKVLVAVRENRTRAGFVGVDTRRMRWTAFVVAGTFAGIAGSLFALFKSGMYVENAFWTQSAQVLIMTLLGGMYSFFGPAIGAAALHMLEITTNRYTEYWPTVLGGILLVILLFLPDGMVGLAQKVRNKVSGKGGAR
ncbi:MAG: branched-chain amino acid ABC transporter permease [Alphaproteobacteria bacterium]|jgi:branched-chain amino acid transport system permease protein